MKNTLFLTLLLIFIFNTSLFAQEDDDVTYYPPIAKQIEKVNTLHGDKTIDNYGWLKDKKDTEVVNYLYAENAYADNIMSDTRILQKKIYDELRGFSREDYTSLSTKREGYFYYYRLEKDKDFPFYCRKKGDMDAAEEIYFDMNAIAKEYFTANVQALTLSPDQNTIAYILGVGGKEAGTLYFRNLTTGVSSKDEVLNASAVTFLNDSTVFYTANDTKSKTNNKIYSHRLETNKSEDKLIYHEKRKNYGPGISISESKEFIFISTSSFNSAEVYFKSAKDTDAEFQLFQPAIPNTQYSLSHQKGNNYFFISTNYKAPDNCLMKSPTVPTEKEKWEMLIPPTKNVTYQGSFKYKDYFVVSELYNGIQKIKVINRKTSESYYLGFKEEIYTANISYDYRRKENKFRFTYTSPVSPQKTLEYNIDTKETILLEETPVKNFNSEEYTSERVWATASDSSRIPIDLFYKKSLKRDGTNPVYLYAYASYGNNQYPRFNTGVLPYTDRNFIYALAHPRGESILGKSWHVQGRLMNKKNTYSDFISCAEFLIEEDYTSKEKIAIQGGSAGGMLMGAVTVMRPDLFKAVIADVPFVDVLNGMQDTLQSGIISHFEEFGNPYKKNEYFYLKEWCPYQNTKAEKHFPNILATGGFNDPRVPYYSPAKWVAKLRSVKTDSSMLMLKTNMAGGHFGSSGNDKQRTETAFKIAFILKSLGIEQNYIELKGKITDEENDPLPFANVYIKGTTNGTMTNFEGDFVLTIEELKDTELVFQSVGYKKKIVKIDMKARIDSLNFTLENENLRIQEVIVTADGKDPAYGIIKNAMSKRKFHYNQVKGYSVDIYMKGSTRLNEIPEKMPSFFPKDEMPDSSDLALMEISESSTRYHYKKKNKAKEEMYASKSSGASGGGYSYNRAGLVDFDFYENQVEVMPGQRGFYSPISSNAMFFYRFSLINSFKDNGKNIYKIKVMPRRFIDPVFQGYIYITDSTWDIHSLDMLIPKSAMLPMTDSIRIKQVFVPVENGISMPLSVQVSNHFKILGFGVTGEFYGNYFNYDVNPEFDKRFFRNEIFRIEKGASEKDTLYWKNNRKVKLTDEEKSVYFKSDSTILRHSSKEYQDSVMKAAGRNRITWAKAFLTGYTLKSFDKKHKLKLNTITEIPNFNTVEGLTLSMRPQYSYKARDKINILSRPTNLLTINGLAKYSVGREQFYGTISSYLMTNFLKHSGVGISAGQDAVQYNPEAQNAYVNAAYSLFLRRNYMKLYQKTFANLSYKSEIINGVYAKISGEYSKNQALLNSSTFSFFNENKAYNPNFIDGFAQDMLYGLQFLPYNSLTVEADFKIIFQQKYSVYPTYKVASASKYPVLRGKYRKGIATMGAETDFDYLEVSLTDDIKLNNFGTLSYAVKVGDFLNAKNVPFTDYKHFLGGLTELQSYKNEFTFEALDYYSHSTNSAFAEAHVTHHFNGWLINKLPLIRRSKIKMVAGGHFLYTENRKDYSELFIGAEQIFQVLRVDLAGQYSSEFGFQPQIRFGITMNSGVVFVNED